MSLYRRDSKQRVPQRRIHFEWMNSWWSTSEATWQFIQDQISADAPFDLLALGCRELKTRPSGAVHQLRDVFVSGNH